MSSKSCSFTGHRYIPDYNTVKSKVRNQIVSLIDEGYTEFFNGGAIGFDMLCALEVISLKKEYAISLNMVLPCENQDVKWSVRLKQIYHYILDNADSVEYVSKEYAPGCMQKRNRVLVDRCDLLLAYNCKTDGGTFYTVNYAMKAGKRIINLAQTDI